MPSASPQRAAARRAAVSSFRSAITKRIASAIEDALAAECAGERQDRKRIDSHASLCANHIIVQLATLGVADV